MKKLIIYDLDGTLVDTREDIARAANHLRGIMGLPLLSRGEVAGFVGHGLHALIQSLLGTQDSKQIEKGARIYRNYYSEHMLDASCLYPGAKECLDYFKKCAQSVITNKPNPFTNEILSALDVAGYFSEIVAGDGSYPKKPDPSAVFALMEKSGASAGETLFIGDSLIDIETARRAGIEIVVLAQGFSSKEELESGRADFLEEDFFSLLKTANREGW